MSWRPTNTDDRLEKHFHAVWDILVEHAGAREDLRDEFIRQFPDSFEWRFMGALGFGGKVYAAPLRVNCYPEDLTDERRAIIKITNALLLREATVGIWKRIRSEEK